MNMDGWKIISVDDACTITDCQHKTAPIVEYITPYKMLRTSNIRNGKIDTINVNYVTEETYKAWSVRGELNINDVILTREAPMGEVGIIPSEERFFLGQRMLQLKANQKLIQPKYLYFSLLSSYFQKQLAPLKGNGSIVANIRIPELKKMRLLIPSKEEEQQKIASILSTWDKAIELKDKLIEQKKGQKKGLMQKLLTGQIRWNDREKYTEEELQERLAMISRGEVPEGYKDTKAGILPEEWMATKLKKISKRVQRKNEGKADKPVLTISSLSGFLNQSDRFSKVIAGENLSKYTLIKKNEFAYNKGNSKTYPCGCVFRLDDYEEALVPNVYYSFQIVEGDTEFYKHYFASGKLNRHLGKVINTGVRNDGLLNLDVNDFFNIPVVCPPKHEQAKIAEILTNAIKEIDYLEREVASIKEQKKGLMQLLLTGRVRVKV